MQIIIQSPHFTPKQELNDFVNKKVNKLSHFSTKMETALVCLKLEKSIIKENKICEIKLSIKGKELFAKRQNKTYEEAISEVVEALHHQLGKN